ncbi:hypothetical protein ACJMK2_037230 [Sinanodonta woodiana]|uniref:Uncharacterized protein n=1 Tax=Sinanodonta woodiana TaxID=1069815 RepID=A0ABD3WN74_SINWO
MCNSMQSSDLDLPPFGALIRVSEPEPAEDIKGQIKAMKRQATKMTPAYRDDAHEENGVLFWVNKSGFPIDDKTWNRMWDHVAKIHPESYTMVKKIMGNTNLPNVPYPQPPSNISPTLSVPDKIEKIQNYMNALQYNHTGTQFFEIRKNRPISGLMECAKDMIREALPIKCLEAVILGIYLTNGMIGVERFPVSFNSTFGGCVHRHVVLGIYYAGRYGAIGMSRRMDLMYKPIVFRPSDDIFHHLTWYNRFSSYNIDIIDFITDIVKASFMDDLDGYFPEHMDMIKLENFFSKAQPTRLYILLKFKSILVVLSIILDQAEFLKKI